MNRAQVCAKICAIQESEGVTFTDDEVKGIICSALNDRSIDDIERWEAKVVEYAARAIRERAS